MFQGDVCAEHQEHLTVFTVSGSVHPSCCRLVSRREIFIDFLQQKWSRERASMLCLYMQFMSWFIL